MPVHAVERQERPKHLGQLLRIGELSGQPHEEGQPEDQDELDDSNDHQEGDERHAQAARVRELAHIEHERYHLVLGQQPELLRRNRCEAWLVGIPGINDVERVEAEEQCEAHGGDLGGAEAVDLGGAKARDLGCRERTDLGRAHGGDAGLGDGGHLSGVEPVDGGG